MLTRMVSTSGTDGAGLTGPNGAGTDEVTGGGETGLAAAALMIPRGISAPGACGAGSGFGIGAVSC